MKYLILFSILLTGCATTNQPLRDIRYTGDNWVVAAQNTKNKVFVHAKNLDDIAVKVEHSYTPFYMKEITVQPTDTIYSIALSEYGDTARYSDIMAQNKLKSVQLTVGQTLYIRRVVQTTRTRHVMLDNWVVKYVNKSKNNVCVNVTYLNMDYTTDIKSGWFLVKKKSSINVGSLIQRKWRLQNHTIAFKDAKWAVNTMYVVKHKKGRCVL